MPLIGPPYSILVAIDLNKGAIAWRSPLGEGTQGLRNHPLLKGVALPDRLGSPSSTGAIATRSGLVFIASNDGYLYAFESATGRELSRVKLPFTTNAGVPMTYRTRSGRQFIVLPSGTGAGHALVAFALPANP
jgi:glucose dehydrogenase